MTNDHITKKMKKTKMKKTKNKNNKKKNNDNTVMQKKKNKHMYVKWNM